jgi:triosephosphate isomerase
MSLPRRPLIAGNWKMHHGGRSAIELAAGVAKGSRHFPGVDVVVAPPFTALAAVAAEVEGTEVDVAAQNLHPNASGAFTGEISGPMLLDAGARWVILGHSERRQLFGETDATVAAKLAAALEFGLRPIVCIGETLAERDAGKTLEVVLRQLGAVLDGLAKATGVAAVAYEPVWAIGTGRNATAAQAEEVHAAIRARLTAHDRSLGDETRILYGGSVKGDNADSLLSSANVDGALVGGASLDAKQFLAIVEAAARVRAPQPPSPC